MSSEQPAWPRPLSRSVSKPAVPQLPDAVIQRILHYIPLHARLRTCATVCKSWAAAAVSATTSMQCRMYHHTAQQKLPLLQSWLSLPGQQLTSLCITYPALQSTGNAEPPAIFLPVGSLQLPGSKLARLRELTLQCVFLTLEPSSPTGPASIEQEQRSLAETATAAAGIEATAAAPSIDSTEHSAGGVHPLLPALQRLDLQHCALNTVEDLVLLAQSTVLTSLQMEDVSRCCWSDSPDGSAPWPTALHKVIAMHSLQDLSIGLPGAIDAADEWPTALPHGLTRLVVNLADVRQAAGAIEPGVLPTAATTTFLSNMRHMTRLEELQLRLCQLDPVLLGVIPGLRKLHLDRCQLLPGRQAGTRALLGALMGLTQLQSIQLHLQSECISGIAPVLFAALTASSQLTFLQLAPVDGQPLIRGAVRHMFRAVSSKPQHLQGLQVLLIRGVENVHADDPHAWCMGDRDMLRIAIACPGLRELKISCVVRPGASCAGLQLLPDDMTKLALAGVAFGDAAAAAVVQLTRLQFLQWYRAPELSDVGFQHLTALTALTWFYCDGSRPSALSEELFRGREYPDDRILRMSGNEPAVPVWRQVRRMCDNSPECTRALRAQVQELQQEVARLWRKVPAIMLDEACHERDAADFEFESDSWDESDSLEED